MLSRHKMAAPSLCFPSFFFRASGLECLFVGCIGPSVAVPGSHSFANLGDSGSGRNPDVETSHCWNPL